MLAAMVLVLIGLAFIPAVRPVALQSGPWLITIWARWTPGVDLGPQGLWHLSDPPPPPGIIRISSSRLGTILVKGASHQTGITLFCGQFGVDWVRGRRLRSGERLVFGKAP